jgi:hypothetical protein
MIAATGKHARRVLLQPAFRDHVIFIKAGDEAKKLPITLNGY